MELTALRIFTRVAELGSFTQAANQLGLTKGQVSTAVRRLEAELGTRLLQRTTRSVRLTADGDQFIERCKDVVADADQLQGMFQPSVNLRGRIRINLPNALARDLLIERMPEFLAAHPLLEVGLSTTDRRVDVVREGFDCVLRVGQLADSDLIAQPLGAMRLHNLAAPSYLRAHGMPTTLADLSKHRLVNFSAKLNTQGAAWDYQEDGAQRRHAMRSLIAVDGTDAYVAACLAGLGLIQAPVHGIEHLIQAGRLVAVMPRFEAASMPVTLLYPNRRQLAPRVKAVVAWMAEVVKPWLEADLRALSDRRV